MISHSTPGPKRQFTATSLGQVIGTVGVEVAVGRGVSEGNGVGEGSGVSVKKTGIVGFAGTGGIAVAAEGAVAGKLQATTAKIRKRMDTV